MTYQPAGLTSRIDATSYELCLPQAAWDISEKQKMKICRRLARFTANWTKPQTAEDILRRSQRMIDTWTPKEADAISSPSHLQQTVSDGNQTRLPAVSIPKVIASDPMDQEAQNLSIANETGIQTGSSLKQYIAASQNSELRSTLEPVAAAISTGGPAEGTVVADAIEYGRERPISSRMEETYDDYQSWDGDCGGGITDDEIPMLSGLNLDDATTPVSPTLIAHVLRWGYTRLSLKDDADTRP